VTLISEIKPGSKWWEVRALTATPPMLPIKTMWDFKTSLLDFYISLKVYSSMIEAARMMYTIEGPTSFYKGYFKYSMTCFRVFYIFSCCNLFCYWMISALIWNHSLKKNVFRLNVQNQMYSRGGSMVIKRWRINSIGKICIENLYQNWSVSKICIV
jgi:hypothetical protein